MKRNIWLMIHILPDNASIQEYISQKELYTFLLSVVSNKMTIFKGEGKNYVLIYRAFKFQYSHTSKIHDTEINYPEVEAKFHPKRVNKRMS